jgi:outer membrane receptor protein involved in Fe transport
VLQQTSSRRALRKTLTALAAIAAVNAMAQPATGASGQTGQPQAVVITGEIAYRDRTPAIAPTLTFGQEYFQRFEPSTAGDMVKRVPSATFVSDVLEFDAVQLRGLAPAYTQVLVNGRNVPGGAEDRSFWLDRIPAEMVERVEVLRSASANRSGDAMAGAINIVLRDAYRFDGSYIRAGVTRYDDGKIKPTVGLVTSTEALGGRILVSLNLQDRYNPKLKRSDRFDEPGGELDQLRRPERHAQRPRLFGHPVLRQRDGAGQPQAGRLRGEDRPHREGGFQRDRVRRRRHRPEPKCRA